MAKRQPKAKTAYELLERVCAAIKAHPLAYYQDQWMLKSKRDVVKRLRLTNEQARESCGTAYCRAGWIVALHDGSAAARRMSCEWHSEEFGERAREILAMPYQSSDDPIRECRLFQSGTVAAHPGTRAYAREGVRGLKAFMEQHKAHLKARKLDGV